MASDQTMVSYTDLTSMLRAVNSTANAVNRLQAQANYLNGAVATVNSNVAIVNDNLRDLTLRFNHMVIEQRKAAALQRALTEIIRVRQELEQNFGKYKTVRDNMMGLLKATDAKLVKTTTITRISEELMLATPDYWLAPLLVAVAAWIGNDQGLAERAIKEAVKRDEEKTALAMALICRRNGRNRTCYEWLAVYFSKQSANDMKRSIITYIDACVSGIFGEDVDNIFPDYIKKWMSELQSSNENFAQEQIETWSNYYKSFCIGNSDKYGLLAQMSTEFKRIDECLQRVNASASIKERINSVISAPVDEEALRNKIDEELRNLVQKYDDEEAPLREEEERLQLIKDYNGDEKMADLVIQYRQKALIDEKVNLAQRLSDTLKSDSQENAAAKKTAFIFLAEYIKGGFDKFVTEKKDDFPETITLTADGWKGTVQMGSDKFVTEKSYETFMTKKKEGEIAKVKNTPIIVSGVLAAISLILGIIMFASSNTTFGVILSIVTVVLAIVAAGNVGKIKNTKKNIEANYAAKIKTGKEKLGTAVDQWASITSDVKEFYAQPDYNVLSLKEAN